MYAADTNNIFLLLKLIRTAPLFLLFLHLHAGALLLRTRAPSLGASLRWAKLNN